MRASIVRGAHTWSQNLACFHMKLSRNETMLKILETMIRRPFLDERVSVMEVGEDVSYIESRCVSDVDRVKWSTWTRL